MAQRGLGQMAATRDFRRAGIVKAARVNARFCPSKHGFIGGETVYSNWRHAGGVWLFCLRRRTRSRFKRRWRRPTLRIRSSRRSGPVCARLTRTWPGPTRDTGQSSLGQADHSRQDVKIRPDWQDASGLSNPRSYGVKLSQPLFQGFRVIHAVRGAEAEVEASREDLRSMEQQVLLSAAQSYLDVVRDISRLFLSRKTT